MSQFSRRRFLEGSMFAAAAPFCQLTTSPEFAASRPDAYRRPAVGTYAKHLICVARLPSQ
jgi:hypothetical protein